MPKKVSEASIQAALADWPTCNDFLRGATEGEAKAALEAEKKGKRRTQYLLRAHARFSKMRAQRERDELLGAD